jgi:trehalose synthase
MCNKISDYIPIIGKDSVDDLHCLAGELGSTRIQNINSTLQGGGVAELLKSTIPLFRDLGLEVEWNVISGSSDFFKITKSIHNVLHGVSLDIDDGMKNVYVNIAESNAGILRDEMDFIVVHDPQPLPLITKRRIGDDKWIWRCHIDVSEADKDLVQYLRPLIDKYDCSVYHLPEYSMGAFHDEYFFQPAIDPFTEKNRDLSEVFMYKELEKMDIDTDLPIILQVSRFDMLKDPLGVIEAFRLARRKGISAQLVLAGGEAEDDPEGAEVLKKILRKSEKDPSIHVLQSPSDFAINALQRAASVVVQKSVREGFGLVVTEAMFKNKPVVGGNVGGIRKQITNGKNGFLVDSVEQTAGRIRQLLTDSAMAEKMGKEAKRSVIENYLMPNLVEKWIKLFLSLKYGKDFEEKINRYTR